MRNSRAMGATLVYAALLIHFPSALFAPLRLCVLKNSGVGCALSQFRENPLHMPLRQDN